MLILTRLGYMEAIMKNLAKNPIPAHPLGVKKGALRATCVPRPKLFTPRSTQTSGGAYAKDSRTFVRLGAAFIANYRFFFNLNQP